MPNKIVVNTPKFGKKKKKSFSFSFISTSKAIHN